MKNYKPQVLVLCGLPKHRPSLLDFANLITKNHSLLIIGDIVEVHWHLSERYWKELKTLLHIQGKLNHKSKSQRSSDVYTFLKSNKIKGFYTAIDDTSFETGATALLQTAGIGKLTPNVLLMGYKSNWAKCPHKELLAYFNVLQWVPLANYFQLIYKILNILARLLIITYHWPFLE